MIRNLNKKIEKQKNKSISILFNYVDCGREDVRDVSKHCIN